MKNLCKILILVMLFTMTNNVLSENKASDSNDSDSGWNIPCLLSLSCKNDTAWIGINWADNLGIQTSLGFSDVYGSIHNLAPISGDHDFGHLAVGVGFFDVPVWDSYSDTLCFNAHINYGTVATLEPGAGFSEVPGSNLTQFRPDGTPVNFGKDRETTYYIGLTYRWFPWAEKNAREFRGC